MSEKKNQKPTWATVVSQNIEEKTENVVTNAGLVSSPPAPPSQPAPASASTSPPSPSLLPSASTTSSTSSLPPKSRPRATWATVVSRNTEENTENAVTHAGLVPSPPAPSSASSSSSSSSSMPSTSSSAPSSSLLPSTSSSSLKSSLPSTSRRTNSTYRPKASWATVVSRNTEEKTENAVSHAGLVTSPPAPTSASSSSSSSPPSLSLLLSACMSSLTSSLSSTSRRTNGTSRPKATRTAAMLQNTEEKTGNAVSHAGLVPSPPVVPSSASSSSMPSTSSSAPSSSLLPSMSSSSPKSSLPSTSRRTNGTSRPKTTRAAAVPQNTKGKTQNAVTHAGLVPTPPAPSSASSSSSIPSTSSSIPSTSSSAPSSLLLPSASKSSPKSSPTSSLPSTSPRTNGTSRPKAKRAAAVPQNTKEKTENAVSHDGLVTSLPTPSSASSSSSSLLPSASTASPASSWPSTSRRTSDTQDSANGRNVYPTYDELFPRSLPLTLYPEPLTSHHNSGVSWQRVAQWNKTELQFLYKSPAIDVNGCHEDVPQPQYLEDDSCSYKCPHHTCAPNCPGLKICRSLGFNHMKKYHPICSPFVEIKRERACQYTNREETKQIRKSENVKPKKKKS